MDGVDDDAICHKSLYPTGFSRGALISGEWKFILNEYETKWYTPLDTSQWDQFGKVDLSSTGRSIQDCTEDYSNPIRNKLYNIVEDPTEQVRWCWGWGRCLG